MKTLDEGMGSAVDLYMTYRFIRALTKSWTDTDAFKLGIIDANGTVLKKKSELKTQEERDAVTFFDRLVWNIKRLLEKLPGGKSKLVTYAAAAWLLKENKESVLGSLQEMIDEESPVNVASGVETKDCLLKKKNKDKEEKDMEKEGSAVRLNRLLLNMKESKRVVKVIRHGTLMRKTKCSPEQRVVDGKCVTKTSKDKQRFKVASRKRVRKMAGKSQGIIMRKREKSNIKRTNMGL